MIRSRPPALPTFRSARFHWRVLGLAVCLAVGLGVVDLPAQNDLPIRARVTKKPRKAREAPPPDEDQESLVRPDQENPPEQPRPRPTPSPPTAPLYLRYPPDQVVVGAVGEDYVLTRLELERILYPNPNKRPVRPADEILANEFDRQQRVAEGQALQEWAVLKTLALAAELAGLRVTKEEADARLAELSAGVVGTGADDPAVRASLAIGIPEEELRQQMVEALLIDKFILSEIEKLFTEQNLQAIYNRNPGRYATPMQVRAWGIFRQIDPSASDAEVREIRGKFNEVRKRAAKNQGRDFHEIAREESDTPNASQTDGDMGWIDFSVPMDDNIARALQRLKVGEVSGIVRSKAGLHVLRVAERREATGFTYDESARKRVTDELIYTYKSDNATRILKTAPFPVQLNPSGLRLVGEKSASAGQSGPRSSSKPAADGPP